MSHFEQNAFLPVRGQQGDVRPQMGHIILTVCTTGIMAAHLSFCSRYRLKCDQLEQKKKDLDCKYSALEKEKKDITDYLRRSLLEKESEVDELTELLEDQRKTAESDRESLQLQHGQQRQELQDQIEGLTSENKNIGETDNLCDC